MSYMKRNLNAVDRSIRIVVALNCIYFGFIDPIFIGDLFLARAIGVFGVINLIAAAIGSCPIYAVAGISSYKPTREALNKS